MKLLKKAISSLLASVMCIPSGILSFAEAGEQNVITTATLSDVENGFMQFSEESMNASTASQDGYNMMQVNEDGEFEKIENDGSIWAFNFGDLVEVELFPDNGYYIKSFSIFDSENGDILAQKETQDNVVSFTMPQTSVIVEASFVSGVSDDGVSDNNGTSANDSDNGGDSFHNEFTSESDDKPTELPEENNPVADKIKSLQGEIDSLPDAIDYWLDEVTEMGEQEFEELKEKVKVLKRAYFEQISDEQASEINPKKLYASLIMLSYYDISEDETYIPGSDRAEELQNRLDDLGDVLEIAFPIELDSRYFVMAYNDGNMESQISNEEMKQKFLDTLNLLNEILDIDASYAEENFDLQNLTKMESFFTTGAGIMLEDVSVFTPGGNDADWWKDSSESGGVTLAGSYSQNYSGDTYAPLSGSYVSVERHQYGGNLWNTTVKMKNQKTGKDEAFTAVAFCGNADWVVDRNKTNGRVYFDAGRMAKLIESRGNSIIKPDGKKLLEPADFAAYLGNDKYKNDKYVSKDQENHWASSGRGILMRMILWYGYGGPGYGKDGMPRVSYAGTHVALSWLYSQQLGRRWSSSLPGDWDDFYAACIKKYADAAPSGIKDFKNSTEGSISDGKLANGADVTFETFCVYVICPTDKDQPWQHIFLFVADGGEKESDPFYLALVKKASKEFRENGGADTNAKLSGAKYKVDFYPNSTAKHVKGLQGKPKFSWTFTTSATDDKGSGGFKEMMKKVRDNLDPDNPIPIAGIDFGPKSGDMQQPRKDWVNKFIDEGDLEKWKENFGKDGAYHIYEAEPPRGFALGGKIEDKGTGASVEDGSRGIVVRIKGDLSKDDLGGDKPTAQIWVEGQEVKKSSYIELEGKKTFSAPLLHTEESPNEWDVKSVSAVTGTGGKKATPDSGEIDVHDKITITLKEAAEKAKKFEVSVKLYDKTADEYLRVTWTPEANQKVDGKAIVHTEKIPKGEKNLTFKVRGKIDTAGMADHVLVFIATVRAKEGDEFSEPKKTSKDDKSEIITFGKEEGEPGTSISHNDIQRKAGTGEAIARAESNQTLTDKITYSGLESGKSYKIKAWLVDAASSSKIEGTDVEETKTASGSNGSWDITLTFDGTEMGGKTLVSFVEIYDGDTLVVDMKDASDKEETVLIPGASTELIDQDTLDHTTTEGESYLIDTITYNNLLPNTTYKVISKLVDPESGEAALEVEGEYRTGDTPNGSWEIKLEMEVKEGEAKSYVAFEEIQIETGEEGSGNWVTLVKHEDPDDESQKTVVPKFKSFAKDQKTDTNISFAEQYVNIYDTIHYENLEQGQEYLIISTLKDKETGEVVYDGSGVEQVIETTFKAEENLDTGKYGSYGDIIPGNHDGDGITFSLNGSDFAGRTLVICEELYKKSDMKLIASDDDLGNENQTIYFPKITTNAITDETGTSIALSGDGTSIIKDTISYENVVPGYTYRIKGRVIDRKKTMETGTEVVATGTDGKPAVNSIDFTPSEANGSVQLSFDIDTSKYADDLKQYEGAVFVVFEELYVIQRYDGADDESIVASHTDIGDTNQTIYIPYITTTLLDTKTGLHIMYAESGASLVDTISYYSCKPGMQFYVSGRLIDMATGKVLRDASGNEAKIEYQPVTAEGSGDGTWDLTYNIDASSLAGTTVVAYAEVYIQGGKGEGGYTQVAVHDDFYDPEERVYIPHIRTEAYDQDTVNHIAHADGSTYIIDKVFYDNIDPNKNYILESELRWRNADGTDGGRVTDASGKEQFLTTKFFADFDMTDEQYETYGVIAPDNENGGIVFHLNTSDFDGKTVVVYERLYIEDDNGMKHLVADHQDIADEDQSIHFPRVWTDALDSETSTKTALADGMVTIVDTFRYENVLAGHTYELTAYLVDKNNTKRVGADKVVYVKDTAGGPVTNTKRFYAEQSAGTVKMQLSFDATVYDSDEWKGMVLVVYEYLSIVRDYLGDDSLALVGSHDDIDDAKQTIYIPYITTTLLDSKTGLHIMYAEKDATLIDTVSYYKCLPGGTYYVSGRLIDMWTGEVLLDSNGDEVRIDYQEVTASNSGDGTWDLVYNFDASTIAGTTVVAYAEVYVKNPNDPTGYSPVAIHDEFLDFQERVYIPFISTTLLDQKTESHYALAEKNVVLYDTVHYTDLLPGDYEYKFETELRDQATGQVVVDDAGKKLFLTTKFIADFDMRDDQFATYGDVIPQNYEGSGITFELDGEYFQDRTLVCYERLYIIGADGGWHIVADHQELLDPEQTIHIGKGWTEAEDSVTKTQTGLINKNTTIVDTFYYKNLNPDYTYELRGKVVEKNTTIATGTDVVVAENTVKNLNPNTSSGTWHNSFTFDTTKYNDPQYYGTVLVVYEYLYQVKRYGGADDELLIAFEADVNNMSQTVWYPHIETELTDYDTKTHILSATEKARVVDTVSYHNMQPNATYTLSGRLINMETGAVLTDAKGKRVEKTMDVRSSSNGDGSWDITYNFDASNMAGTIIVAYAEVYVKNGDDDTILSPVAIHNEFWDLAERVYIPIISTVATDQKTNSHISFAENDMWITDRVYYSYLQPDSDYRLISTLVDKDTGEVVIDDKGITQRIETTFNTKPNSSQEKYLQTISNPFTDSSDTGTGYAYGYVVPGDGTVLPDGSKPDGIVFSFDGGTFEGRTLVIYEELQIYKADGTWATVATHMDINDENQTIHIPKIRTNAVDSETMTHLSKKDGSVTILDTITYENLIPGLTYTLEGCLMDKLRDDQKTSTEIKDANGHKITGSVTFTPKRPNGTETVTFQGNVKEFQTDEGEFSSETLVVFEDLYLLNSKDSSNDRLKIAEHRDINDENQTIYFPRSKTKVVTYDLNGNPKQGDANHVNGYAVFDCTYCKKSFLTETEAQNHINSTVLCKNKGAKVKAVTEYTVYDTLYYENLIPGRTYQVVGTLIDTATGEAVLNGHQIVQSDTKYFTPGDKNGEVDVVFHIDGLNLAGGRYVVYEEVFLNGSSVTSHMDINDKDQMFNIIDMTTSAKDATTGTRISTGNTISNIIDTVEMGPLVENEKYYLHSVLMDVTKDAAGTKSENYGSYYKDATGQMVQGNAWRVKGTDVWHEMTEPITGPDYARTGGMLSVEVRFAVDTITEHGGKNFQGETYVLFEELRLENGEVVAQHKDLTDEQQTIKVGGMYTVAYDKDTGTNIMEATDGKTLYDTVYYSNLKPSSTYKLTTRIYVKEDSNMETGEYVEVTPLNATNLVAASHVTSRSGTGSWTVSASMPDLSQYAGKTLVVYEDIVDADGVQVVVENNLYNESQSIHLPAASTFEADDENGLHFTRSEGTWLCDNDSCVTYTCNGCGTEFHSEDEAQKHLPDCWNRESDGFTCTSGIFHTKAEAEKHIAPVYECDNCKLHFADEEDADAHVNGECKKATVLRATQLVRDENNNTVNELWYACSGCGAQFKTNQECLDHINGSDICYSYTDINAEHASFHNVNASITDTVTYTNLIPGRQYRIDGWVYNAETGEKALDAEGEEITASAVFVPMSSRGSAELKFKFNAVGMEGYKYSVYAEVYYVPSGNGKTPVVVARHNEDLNAVDESFYIPAVSTSAVDSYTETNVTLADTVTTIRDTVTFSGLKANEKYLLKGTIMDAATMEKLVLPGTADAVETSRQFTAKATSASDMGITVADGIASGWTAIDFTFSTSGLEGKTLVVFEELYLVQPKENVIIGQHTEIMDEKQTTHIPMMRTYAYDVETGEQSAGADESVMLEDKVILTNLVKGKRYKLEARLMDPVTGKAVQDANGHDIMGTLDVFENNANNIFTASTSGRTVKTMKFVFDGSNLAGKTVVVWETLYMEGEKGSYSVIAQHNPLPDANYEGADMDYLNQSIAFPDIRTTARDADTNTIFSKAGKSTIIDTVEYKNLTAGLEYKMVGTIYDVKTGQVLADTLNDSYTVTKYFKPEASGNGTVDLEFSFSTKNMAGRTFVVFEELYLNDVLIAEHKDPDDLKQTIKVPEIGTTALSEDLELHMTNADDDAVIIDTVEYKNLIPDREYTVKGVLMDKKTKAPLLDFYGDEIRGETTFTPEKENGTVEVQFRFNAAKMEGIVAVAFEELFYMDASIAEHEDINDEEQTVYFPKAWSLAKGNETGGTHVGAADSIMTITDTVYYENLLGDREYHVHGEVIDAETGKPAVDANGDEVVEELTFTTAHPDADSESKAVSGSVDLVFTFDATGMRGKTLVIYEYIYYHKTTTSYLDYPIAKHDDLKDEMQMIHIPEIGTTAWDSETKHHITKADDNATIIDTVAYKNLVPGLEYTLDAYLIDLDNNGEPAVDDFGVEIRGTTVFTPKDWNGTVDVRFNDHSIESLAGHTLVAFEFLYYGDTLIEHHDNPEDEAQMIHIPKIDTHARSFESDSQNSNAEAYINVVDEIEFWNLVPGLEYTAMGVIMNKKTGQPAIDAEGNYITGSTTFTPDERDGVVDVVFTFDATGMEDTDMVVFEEIFYQGDLPERASVAEHSDLMDEDQSVTITQIHDTMLLDSKTGLKMALAEEEMVLTDTVTYKGLYPGTQYELVGKLLNAETKEPLHDANGEEIVATLWFTPEEKQGHEELTFEFSGKHLEGITLAAYTELYVVKDGDELSLVAKHNENLTDKDEMVSIPKARTTAAEKDSNINYSEADGTVTLIDTITYEGLIPGYAYTASGVLVDKETQEPILDKDGNEITAETVFVVHEPDGSVEVTFTFNAEGFDGKTYNVFETISCNGQVVAEHKDPNDENQDIHFTDVSTNAFGTSTKIQMVLAEERASITDTIHYKNFKPGEEYTVIGKLFDAETGEPVTDPSINTNPYEVLDITEYWVCDSCGSLFFKKEDATAHITGSECEDFTLVLSYDEDEYKKLLESAQITVEKTFTAESADGSVDLVYNINTKILEGKSVVATAVIRYKDTQIGSHTDLKDENETVHIPEIGTTAVDAENGMHVSNPDGTISIVDTVEYKNLVPGMEYIVSGYLVDKATGEPALDDDGNEITAETKFTAENADGTVSLTFTFDGKKLAGHSLVAFETLMADTELKPVIAEHKDPDDEEQTVDLPEIRTSAADAVTNSNILKAGETTTVKDRVYYHNLDYNKTYTISGVLIDKETGKPITDENGEEIKAVKEFTPKRPDGYVDIEFTFDASSHLGKTLVAFEELLLKGHIIAEHKDPDDKDQTVYVPEIGTTATDKETGTHVAKAGNQITIVDKVAYSNIAAGEAYKLIGVLVDGETGEALCEPVETDFTAEAESGTAEVEFIIDAAQLKGRKVVVFEELQAKSVTKVTEVEVYVCNQCGKEFDSEKHAVWHFEDSENCGDYTVNFKTEKEYGEFVTIAEHKDLNDKGQTVYVPEIHTTAKDAETNTKLSYADGETVIIDTVYYEGLEPGREYEVTGTLMDKETGKPAMVDGNPVTATAKFTPETESGSVDVTFRFDSTEYAGKALVAYEKLSINGTIVAEHEDPNDEDQTVYIPEIGTTALDKTTGEHIGPVGDTIIVDTVAYHNLVPGLTYTVKGVLMNKATGKEYTAGENEEESGEICTAETTFTAKEADGTVELVFHVKSSKNLTLVAFEELFFEDKLIADHKDIEDEGQSVSYPEIRTNATNKETGGHTIPSTGMATIVDTVTYENLIPGKEYTINGELMDKETGKGTGYTSSITFTPDTPNGSVQLEFEVDASALGGHSVVAFETLYHKDVELTSHADINDKDQTVDIPEIRTHASDKLTQTQVVTLGDKVVVIDVVTYKGLTPGREYTMSGMLMLKGENGAVSSTGITATKTFTPDKPDGSVELEFIVDSTKYAGMSLVAYEKLFDKDVVIAEHEDPEDEDQTVHVPEIGTTASVNNEKDSSKQTEIVDIVRYKNLVPGMSYTLNGKLMDKATGKELGITASTAFTPKTADGEVRMTFTIDTALLKNGPVVVFETLILNDIVVAKHEDINDENQTVTTTKIATHATDEATGTKVVALGDKVAILDTVTYEGLTPGKEYTMSGTLMLKGSGGTVESTKITATQKFTPDKPNGEVVLKFIIDSTKYAGMSLVAYEKLFDGDTEIAEHEDPEDEDQTVYVPEIRTSASSEGKKEVKPSEKIVITDKVTYKNLVPGIEYTMSGTLMDKETGKPVGIASVATFTPDKPDGSVDMTFTIDTSSMAGKSLVVFEELKVNGIPVAKHEDIDDKEQTVDITPEEPGRPEEPDKPESPKPEIRTLAQAAGKKSAVVSNITTITDTVAYKNLTPGRKYTMSGILMDKATGKALLADSREVTAEKEFTAASADGTVEMTFTFDSSKLAGTTLVVFETLKADGEVIAEHKDINDEDQSVHLVEKPGPDSPEIRTTATINGAKSANASAKTVIHDEVTYRNLKVGTKYTMKGVLMDKSTKKPLLVGGKKVTSEAEFTPKSKDGSITMTFVFDSSALTNSSLVVFEELYIREKLAASHEDINDEDQTVKITKVPETPYIRTHAEIDGKKSASASKKTTIIDKVTYHNLTPGKEYTMKGVLMNKATGKELLVNGKTVRAETKFKPEKADGTVEMKFVFDSSALKGFSIVVFEDLYDGDRVIATHHDITDKDQTVGINTPPENPEIRTNATINGKKTAAPSTMTTIVDKVTYTGLTPGAKYTLTGFLMNKASGKKLSYGGRVLSSTVTFTPESADGSVDMKFTFDSSNCSGMSIVVFEYLYADGKLTASHEDLNDEDQTVTIVKPAPNTPGTPQPAPGTPVPSNPTPGTQNPPVKVKTGDSYLMIAAAFAVSILILGVAAVILRKKKD